jgi:hypothetical protein
MDSNIFTDVRFSGTTFALLIVAIGAILYLLVRPPPVSEGPGFMAMTVEAFAGFLGSKKTAEFVVMLLLAGMAFVVAMIFMGRSQTRPLIPEGFAVPTLTGAMFPCSTMTSEGSLAYDMVSRAVPENDDDLRYFHNLLGKLACFKQDLMGPGQVISASKYLEYDNQQDIRPLSDMTGQCFNKGVPDRDVDIQFDKWQEAGLDLIRRLCSKGGLDEKVRSKVEGLFKTVHADVYAVAKGKCVAAPVDKAFAVGAHDPAPVSSTDTSAGIYVESYEKA